jgi:hypothetical protein
MIRIQSVIPANAGISSNEAARKVHETPAFAGVTKGAVE